MYWTTHSIIVNPKTGNRLGDQQNVGRRKFKNLNTKIESNYRILNTGFYLKIKGG